MNILDLAQQKTKIVCTIGPACRGEGVLMEMLKGGMNAARLNFAHGTVESHLADIRSIRKAEAESHHPCLILADLPGPKIRIGRLRDEPLELLKGEAVTLTTETLEGTKSRISVNYARLPESVVPGSVIFLNDGFIQLETMRVEGPEVHCKVIVGGQLLSNKGVNIPGAKLLIQPVTERDLFFAEACLSQEVCTFCLSFVEKADDIRRLRDFASERGKKINIVAKIERAEAVRNIDDILDEADALMIARGDLGVQIPIEEVPLLQKRLILKSRRAGKPVITATQMLVSMTENVRPTRAEASDVANAILDGTDALMLSEETAIGRYPVEPVKTMSRIAKNVESGGHSEQLIYKPELAGRSDCRVEEVLSLKAAEAAQELNAKVIVTPTRHGNSARKISSVRPDCWVVALSSNEDTLAFLGLSYGVLTLSDYEGTETEELLKASGLARKGDVVIVAMDSTPESPNNASSIRIFTIK